MERSTLSARSRRLFTLSAIYTATSSLLHNLDLEEPEARAKLSAAFWDGVAAHMSEWRLVQESRMTSGEVREGFIHSHGVVLHALGVVGNAILLEPRKSRPVKWQQRLAPLGQVDWRRSSPSWEGRATVGGRVSKSFQNVILTSNFLKSKLGLPLHADEQRVEDAYTRGENEPA
jgi:DNA sulfur modification protein DndB